MWPAAHRGALYQLCALAIVLLQVLVPVSSTRSPGDELFAYQNGISARFALPNYQTGVGVRFAGGDSDESIELPFYQDGVVRFAGVIPDRSMALPTYQDGIGVRFAGVKPSPIALRTNQDFAGVRFGGIESEESVKLPFYLNGYGVRFADVIPDGSIALPTYQDGVGVRFAGVKPDGSIALPTYEDGVGVRIAEVKPKQPIEVPTYQDGVGVRFAGVKPEGPINLIHSGPVKNDVTTDRDVTVDYSGWRVVRTAMYMYTLGAKDDILNKIEAHPDARLLHTFIEDGLIMLDVMLNNGRSIDDITGLSLRTGLSNTTVLVEDLGNVINNSARAAEGRLSWDRYYRASSIQNFNEELASNNDNVELLRIGTTHEGRPIQALVIADNSKQEADWYKLRYRPSSKPIIMLEFGLHAREWISPAVGTYIANELSKMGSSFLKHATWVIIPLANPDGYDYSHTKDRMWRKNRRPNYSNRRCPGVDLNRNFDIEWAIKGSSSNPCSEVYHGTSPMSEAESIAIKKLLTRFSNIKLYMSVHSYSQVFLYPYAYTEDPAPNERELRNFAQAFSRNIMKKGGRNYGVEQAGVGFASGGGSDDYAYKQGATLSYTLELPDKGHYGFIMPESQIFSISREMWAGFKCQLGEIVPEAKGYC